MRTIIVTGGAGFIGANFVQELYPLDAIAVGAFALFAKPLILLMYGEEFLPSVRIFYVMVPRIVLWPIAQFFGIHIVAEIFSKMKLETFNF